MHDNYGQVDGYIKYLLNDIVKNVSQLIIVCNGEMSEQGLEDLKKYSDSVYIRENKGFDAKAFQYLLLEKVSLEELKTYDELLIFNDTFYGPFYPLKIVFDKMTTMDCDFWGLTEHYDFTKYPHHIQSYFLTIRKSLFLADSFFEYWRTIPEEISEFDSLVMNYEVRFTQFFENRGYKGITFCNCNVYKSDDVRLNFNQYAFLPYHLIKDQQFPILKKKNFTIDELYNTEGAEEMTMALEYIKNETPYDVSLIWNNLLKNYDIAKIQNSVALNYVVSSKDSNSKQNNKKIGIFIYGRNDEKLIECIHHLRGLDDNISVQLFIGPLVNQSVIEDVISEIGVGNYFITIVEEQLDPTSTFLNYCFKTIKKYDYICYTHDEELARPQFSIRDELSIQWNNWENLIGDAEYIKNVIDIFEKDENLGLLTANQSLVDLYCNNVIKKWEVVVGEIEKYVVKNGVSISLNKKILPKCYGNNFWVRTTAFKSKDDIQDIDKGSILDRALGIPGDRIFDWIISYLAQTNGYYSGIVSNAKVTSIQMMNIKANVYKRNQLITKKSHILNYYVRYKKVYIYGAGKFGAEIARWINEEKLKEIETIFIVSDGQRNEDTLEGFPIYEFSKLENDKSDYGLIIALSEKNYNEIKDKLHKAGIFNYCTVYDI